MGEGTRKIWTCRGPWVVVEPFPIILRSSGPSYVKFTRPSETARVRFRALRISDRWPALPWRLSLLFFCRQTLPDLRRCVYDVYGSLRADQRGPWQPQLVSRLSHRVWPMAIKWSDAFAQCLPQDQCQPTQAATANRERTKLYFNQQVRVQWNIGAHAAVTTIGSLTASS